MSLRLVPLALALGPVLLAAQQPADSARVRSDSTHPVTLQEITVTAAAVRREAPLGSVTVPAAIIRQTPALNTVDLLRQTAGVEAHDQGQGPGFASDLAIRGFSSDHSTDMALWIDGVPINEPVNGHAEGYNDWSLLMPQAVRQIDVFKGPTSALYGNFALAGTVNVRTLERMTGTDLSLDGGMYGRVEGAVLSGFDHEQSGGVFGLRAIRESGWRPNSGYRLGQGHARVVRDLSASTSLDAGIELYAAGWDSPGFLTLAQFNARQYDSMANLSDGGFKRHAQERVSLRVTGNSGMVWRSTLYSTQGRWQLYLTTPPEGGATEGSGSQLDEEDHRYGFGATSALTWSLARSTEITIGGEGRWDHSHYENYFTTSRVRDSTQTDVTARQASGAVFLQSSSEVLPRLVLSLGGRYEAQGIASTPAGESSVRDTKGVVAPKFGALYRIPGFGGIYGNVSRGFRRTDGVIEDPTLPFITAWAYEGGIKLDRGVVHGSAAVFQMDVSNEQTFNPATLTSTSGGRSRRKGLELGLEAQLSPALSANGDFTVVDAKYRNLVTEDGDTLSGARVFNTAKYVGDFALGLAPPTAIWNLRLSANVVGRYTAFDEPDVEVGSYGLLHVSGGVRFGTVLVSAGVRNLLDHAYPELRAGGFVSPGQPRSVYGTVRYVF